MNKADMIEKEAEVMFPYPDNDLYKEGDPDLEEMIWVVNEQRKAYIAGRTVGSEFEKCLAELVRLKDIKDAIDRGESQGMDGYLNYKRDKETAWQKARELLNK